jgi:hypothetical protein
MTSLISQGIGAIESYSFATFSLKFATMQVSNQQKAVSNTKYDFFLLMFNMK